VIRAIDAPVGIGDQWLQVTASIGIAIYPDDDRDDVRELLKKADQAMYVAKRAGRNTYRFYSDGAQLRVG
jgi:diguanylate cyclase (GGDEF)-like protein